MTRRADHRDRGDMAADLRLAAVVCALALGYFIWWAGNT